MKNTKKIIYDDYNQRIPRNQDVVGTVTTQYGNSALRHGFKIIEAMNGIIQIGNVHPNNENQQQARVYDTQGLSPTIRHKETQGRYLAKIDMEQEKKQFNLPPELEGKKFRIRKLTPRECFRLMGVHDKDIDKIQSTGLSNSSQYKLAGNSIVVDVLYYMFENLFIGDNGNHDSNGQLSLF